MVVETQHAEGRREAEEGCHKIKKKAGRPWTNKVGDVASG